MRICLVSEYYYPTLGGITEHIYQYARQCLKRGHEVTLLTSHAGEIDPTLIPAGLRIEQVGGSYPIMSNGSFARVTLVPFLGTKIRKFFDRNTFDVVHIHAAMTPMLPLLALKYRNTLTVGTIHTYFERNGHFERWQRQCQSLIGKHDAIIAVSQSCIEAMEHYFQFDSVIIPNGIDTEYFARGNPLPSFANGPYTIFFLGRLDPRNGLDTLIEGFVRLRARGVPSRLIVAGDGPLLGHYKGLIPSVYKKDVVFVGAINRERPDFFASVDTFCYPATKASFGITLLEAMAAGVPVVASNIRGFREIVQQDKQGILVPETHPDALADAFERLANDRNLRIRMGERGRKRAEEFSWDRVGQQILDFYKTLSPSSQSNVRVLRAG